jgi:hypothetical protein
VEAPAEQAVCVGGAGGGPAPSILVSCRPSTRQGKRREGAMVGGWRFVPLAPTLEHARPSHMDALQGLHAMVLLRPCGPARARRVTL